MASNSLRLPEVSKRTGLCGGAIWAKTNPNNSRYDPSFPKPIKIGKRAVAWLENEIDAWLDTRIAERDNQQAEG